MEQYNMGGSWWRSFYKPHPVVFILLILIGVDLEYVIHYHLGITTVYTQFYYLIIVIAGLWYGKKAIWIALFFGGLHVIVAYILAESIFPDAVTRCLIMLITAFVIGSIVEQMNLYYDKITEQNRQLSDMNARMDVLNARLVRSQASQWQNIVELVKAQQLINTDLQIESSAALDGLEIFADPLLKIVFEDLIDNSRRHGEHVTQIRVSHQQKDNKVILFFEDNGIGISEQDKEKIFTRDVGKNTGLGLFLAREILAITGITIHETGELGKGARFEITVPQGAWRYVT